MCGIVGQVDYRGGPPDRDQIERMCAAVGHRGPDSRGLFFDGNIALGIQRLRVIDLVTGDQPIKNEDGSVVVVLNGEIYNFRELRSELERRGHRLSTQGDTEVIVHLYEEHGVDCVRHLRGMFAFALWDRRRSQLMLARDRVGKKPLFYALRDDCLTFGSELPSLLEDRSISRELDLASLDAYLTYGYIPAPRSAFAAIRKLPPAHTLVVKEGHVSLERYWRLDYGSKLNVKDPRELHEPIRDAIKDATRHRLISDVPLGAFLSGGIDSSAVVAAMAHTGSGTVKTFSIGFEEAAFDELPHARQVAKLFATDHHEFVVRPDTISLLPKIVRHYGEPFADSSAIPSWHLAEVTRRHVTVALNGDGGDESFGGYTRYVANQVAHRLDDALPPAARRLAGALAARSRQRGDVSSVANRARRLARALALAPPARHRAYMSKFDERDRAALYTPELAEQIDLTASPAVTEGPWHDASGSDLLDIMLEVDVSTYLPGDLITKIDIATMAHSLEARSPLLDHEFMQFAASIPAAWKIKGSQKKWILRDALRDWLPPEILDRPKQGFQLPLDQWLRGDLSDYAREVLLDQSTLGRGYFQPDAVRALIERQPSGTYADAERVWTLLMLELWHREFVDGPCRSCDASAAPAMQS